MNPSGWESGGMVKSGSYGCGGVDRMILADSLPDSVIQEDSYQLKFFVVLKDVSGRISYILCLYHYKQEQIGSIYGGY